MLFNPKYPSPLDHVVVSQQFTEEYLEKIFLLTDDIRANPEKYKDTLAGKIVAMLFYEASTRTRFSFESAVMRLGGHCLTTESAKLFSSASKGETIEDTIRVTSAYCDAIVLRHFEDDSSKRAVHATKVPLINAGSGKSQHPTQALLDVYTIHKEFGRLSNLNITIVGDLLNGRTCDSLVYLLSKFTDNRFTFVAPGSAQVKDSLKIYLSESRIEFDEVSGLNGALCKSDVVYMTRIQKERFVSTEAYQRAKGKYILTNKNVDMMKEQSIVMHPLPRVDEIAIEVDSNHRARYFEQAENGLWVRMALLHLLFSK